MAPGTYAVSPAEHTLNPVVTGSTTIGVKYNGGILVAADTLVSYGNYAKFKGVSRLKQVGKYTILGSTGEYSDFQHLGDLVDELDLEDFLQDDGCYMGPRQYASYIGRVMYNRRSKFNPLFNQFVIAGQKGAEKPYLAYVDHQGTFYEEDFIATGFGLHLAIPLLRNEWKPTITKEEAVALIEKCLRVCFYRDCKAYNRIQIACVDESGTSIGEPKKLDDFWRHPDWLKPGLQTSSMLTDTW